MRLILDVKQNYGDCSSSFNHKCSKGCDYCTHDGLDEKCLICEPGYWKSNKFEGCVNENDDSDNKIDFCDNHMMISNLNPDQPRKCFECVPDYAVSKVTGECIPTTIEG